MLGQKVSLVKVVGITLVVCSFACYGSVTASSAGIDHEKMDHSGMGHGQHHDDEHAHHRAMQNQEGYEHARAAYATPDITLIDQNGDDVSMVGLLDGDDPVMLNFIFTSCTTICPLLTTTFSQVHKEYGAELDGVKMVSVSIDPEYDTPTRLKTYAQRFDAAEDWIFLTGNLEAIIALQTAFDAYRGDKMNHVPLTFVRRAGETDWIRLEGFPGTHDLLNEYRSAGDRH